MAGQRLAVSPAAPTPVDDYLDALAGSLRGPRRRRRRILAEIRDGLDHAVAGHGASGMSAEQAVTAAIAEFGPPQAVADAFAGELATAYARRTIAGYVITGPLVGVWWLLLLQPRPWEAGIIAVLTAIPVIPLVIIGIGTAAGTLATTGRLIRWLPEAGPRHALGATAVIAALATAGDVSLIALYGRSGLSGPFAVLALAASSTRIGCSMVTLRHAAGLLLPRRGVTRRSGTARRPPPGRSRPGPRTPGR